MYDRNYILSKYFKIYAVCVFVYIYIINIHNTLNIYNIFCQQKTKTFILDAINSLTALLKMSPKSQKNSITEKN